MSVTFAERSGNRLSGVIADGDVTAAENADGYDDATQRTLTGNANSLDGKGVELE